MKFIVDNLKDFWNAADNCEEATYSIVIEGSDGQCVLYAYDLASKSILNALILPRKLRVPIEIDVEWSDSVAKISINQTLHTEYNIRTFQGTSSDGLVWV